MSCHGMMMGLPGWALGLALGLACAISLWSVVSGPRFFKGARSQALGRFRVDLFQIPPLHWLMRQRGFQTMLQLPVVGVLGWILYSGLLGTRVADHSPATVLTWTFWWTLLIVDIVLLGRTWCLICPFDALASWARRLTLWGRSDEPAALNLPWPKWLKNVYPATLLFVLLTWLELGFGVTQSPRATAWLGLAMVFLAVFPALIFEKRSFCHYGCLIGRICGLYSMVAPVELRSRDAQICKDCKTKDCLQGNERGYPCPTGQCVPTLDTNAYCTLCTECVKSCPSDNVSLRLRPWGTDLHTLRTPRKDEAVLALVMVSLTSFHGLTMTPSWNRLVGIISRGMEIPHLLAFSLGMALVLVMPGLLFLASCWLVRRSYQAYRRLQAGVASTSQPQSQLRPARLLSLGRFSAGYAYPLVAVALMYHLAHNAGHFLTEARVLGNIIPGLSHSAGAMSAGMITPLVSQQTIWVLAIFFVLLGHLWGCRAMERAHRRPFGEAQGLRPLMARITMALFLLTLTSINLWLLAQPMEMRTAM